LEKYTVSVFRYKYPEDGGNTFIRKSVTSYKSKKKKKAIPLHAMVALGGGRGSIALLILDLGTRWG
jgi:hypothetical protein